jgi:anti-anti-sigma regulatory factor
MTLRIERQFDGERPVLRVSGRIAAENLEELKAEAQGMKVGTVLDLEHVTLVDVDGVRFLCACQAGGMELLHCSPYIREWMTRERMNRG